MMQDRVPASSPQARLRRIARELLHAARAVGRGGFEVTIDIVDPLSPESRRCRRPGAAQGDRRQMPALLIDAGAAANQQRDERQITMLRGMRSGVCPAIRALGSTCAPGRRPSPVALPQGAAKML